MTLSNELVPKFYKMDPKTEDFLTSGHKLREGMVVLVGESSFRSDIHRFDEAPEWMQSRMLVRNRWGRVLNTQYNAAHNVSSVALVFADETVEKINISSTIGWLVKKDSVPTERDKLTEISSIIRQAIRGDFTKAEQRIELAAKNILELL